MARPTANGCKVRAVLPLATPGDLIGKPIARGSKIRFGLFRADFYGKEKADRGELLNNCLTWVRPKVGQRGFHVPSALPDWTIP